VRFNEGYVLVAFETQDNQLDFNELHLDFWKQKLFNYECRQFRQLKPRQSDGGEISQVALIVD